MLPLLRCFFAHLLILHCPDHHQNLINSSLYYSGPVHKISSQSVHNFLSNVVHRQTDRQTNQPYQKHNFLCQGGNCQGGNKGLGAIYISVVGVMWLKKHPFYYASKECTMCNDLIVLGGCPFFIEQEVTVTQMVKFSVPNSRKIA